MLICTGTPSTRMWSLSRPWCSCLKWRILWIRPLAVWSSPQFLGKPMPSLSSCALTSTLCLTRVCVPVPKRLEIYLPSCLIPDGDIHALTGVVEYLSTGGVDSTHKDFKELRYIDSLTNFNCNGKNGTSSTRITHGFKLKSAYENGLMPFTNYTFDFKVWNFHKMLLSSVLSVFHLFSKTSKG